MRSVVVTGLGAVTPLGRSVEDSWAKLCAGRSGIRPITQFDVSGLRTRVAGQVPDFAPEAYMTAKLAGRVDRFVQLGVAAARQAVQHARLTVAGAEAERVAVVMGNTFAGVLLVEKGCEQVAGSEATMLSPFFVPGAIGNTAAGVVAMELGAKGPNLTVNQACASGAAAIGLGLGLLRSGAADVVIAGGCEAALARVIFCGYHSLKATTANKSMLGHTIGAAGAIEAAFSVLSLRDGVIPPTVNYEHPDPDCEPVCVATELRPAPLRTVLSNSFAFGGINATLVFRKA